MTVTLLTRKSGRIALVCLLLSVIGLIVCGASGYILADYHVRKAEKALARQRYPQALESYERALHYLPESAEIHLFVARTARRVGNFLLAKEHLRRCRELQKGVSEEQQVEEILLRAQTGEIDQVHSLLVPYLLQEGPLTPMVLEALVRANMAKYRMAAAWNHLRRWLELEPDNVEALFRRGTWFAQQQNVAAASVDYRRGLELDPERIDIRLVYAEMLRADKKFAEVAEQYKSVLSQSARDPNALVGLAQCCLELGKVEEARELLDSVPSELQDSAEVYWLRGLLAMRMDLFGEAEVLLRKTLAREPRHFDACYNLMLCLSRLNKTAEANAASVRLQQIEQDQKRLIEITTKELNNSPSSSVLYCELGEIYLRFGIPSRALHWLNGALRLDPGYRRAHEILRDYYDSLGPEGWENADIHRQQLAEPR